MLSRLILRVKSKGASIDHQEISRDRFYIKCLQNRRTLKTKTLHDYMIMCFLVNLLKSTGTGYKKTSSEVIRQGKLLGFKHEHKTNQVPDLLSSIDGKTGMRVPYATKLTGLKSDLIDCIQDKRMSI